MGRKLLFDKQLVINKTAELFHKNGYVNTSLIDIENFTGVKKASLHNTFGTKDELFNLALDSYFKKTQEKWESFGAGLTFIDNFFNRLITQALNKEKSNGCLIMNSSIEFSTLDTPLEQNVSKIFNQIRNRFQTEILIASPDMNKEDSLRISKSFVSLAFSIRSLSKVTNDPQFFKIFKQSVSSLKNEISQNF